MQKAITLDLELQLKCGRGARASRNSPNCLDSEGRLNGRYVGRHIPVTRLGTYPAKNWSAVKQIG